MFSVRTSRWVNYYVEGLQWLSQDHAYNTDSSADASIQTAAIDGVYLDELSFDRSTMQRMRKAVDQHRSGSLFDLHSCNKFRCGVPVSALSTLCNLCCPSLHCVAGAVCAFDRPIRMCNLCCPCVNKFMLRCRCCVCFLSTNPNVNVVWLLCNPMYRIHDNTICVYMYKIGCAPCLQRLDLHGPLCVSRFSLVRRRVLSRLRSGSGE